MYVSSPVRVSACNRHGSRATVSTGAVYENIPPRTIELSMNKKNMAVLIGVNRYIDIGSIGPLVRTIN